MFHALSSQIWIGLYSPVGETEWIWTTTGKFATYLNFKGNPASDRAKLQCACINLDNGVWTLCPCEIDHEFICSRAEFPTLDGND